jgi:hypothetical protein
MAEGKDRNFVLGISAMGIGLVLALLGALWAHFTGLSEFDDVGRELYPNLPRGWGWVLLGQLTSLAGVLIFIGGTALAFLYDKKLTWARAAVGAGLFTALMIILFGVIPNEWLTYTQAVWEWTDQKLWIKIPADLIGGNELNISAAVVKDVVAGTYVLVLTGVIAVAMIRWQKRDEMRAAKDKAKAGKENLSSYGRPLQKVER